MARGGRPGKTYLVGGRNERTNLHIVETLCDVIDRVSPGGKSRRELITFVTDRPGHDYRYAIDASHIENELGWLPAVTLESGLELTVRWYIANAEWWGPLRASRYAGERLGLPTGVR